MNSAIQIRSARPADIPRLMRLLPGIARKPSQTQTYVVEKSGAFVGCGSLCFESETSCSFNWNFIAPEEKPVAAASLFSAFQTRAEKERMKILTPHFGVMEGSDEAKLLESFGCEERVAFAFYETDIEKSEALFNRAVLKLEQRKKIPSGVRVIPLEQAPILPVQTLWRNSIGVGDDAMLLQFEQQRFCPNHSVVAMDGPRVVGAVAMDISGKIPVASYMAIEASYRGRWPYALLMREVHARLRKSGHSRLHFKTNSKHHSGVKNFAEKIGGKLCGREIHYVLKLGKRFETVENLP